MTPLRRRRCAALRARLLRGAGRATEQREPAQRSATIAAESWSSMSSTSVGSSTELPRDAHAGVGEAELHLPPIDGVEHARHVAWSTRRPTASDIVAGVTPMWSARSVSIVGGSASRWSRMLTCRALTCAAGLWVADVAAVAGEVDAGIVAEDRGDVGAEAHVQK